MAEAEKKTPLVTDTLDCGVHGWSGALGQVAPNNLPRHGVWGTMRGWGMTAGSGGLFPGFGSQWDVPCLPQTTRTLHSDRNSSMTSWGG